MSIVQLLAINDPEEEKKYNSDLADAIKKLQDRDSDVIELQKKVIELYEKLHQKEKS